MSLAKAKANVPLQEAGRNPNNVLVLARANKSVRVFEHIVEALARGEQPEPKELLKLVTFCVPLLCTEMANLGLVDFKLLEDNPDFN